MKHTKEQIISIASALLSSGHYSRVDADDNEPIMARYDRGKDWQKEGLMGRFGIYAVADAIDVLDQVDEEVRNRECLPNENINI